MKYKVIRDFIDTTDQAHNYHKGDAYPRKGKPSKERINLLIGNKNKAGIGLIEEEKEGLANGKSL